MTGEMDFSKCILNKIITEINILETTYNILYWGAVEQRKEVTMWSHPYNEICLVLDGEGEYQEDGETLKVHKNNIVVPSFQHEHKFTSEKGITIVWLVVDFDKMTSSGVIKHEQPVLEELEDDNPLIFIWKTLLHTAITCQNSPSYESVIPYLVQSLFQAFDSLFNPSNKLQLDENSNGQPIMIDNIKHYIKDNMSRHLTVDIIAHHFYISKRQVFRLFKDNDVVTCNQYIQQVRIEEAVRLLKVTNTSVMDISYIVGFSSPSYFSKVFTEYVGHTPNCFREICHIELKQSS